MKVIGSSGGTLEAIRRVLGEGPLVALRQHLTDQHIINACNEHGYTYRNRQYGPVITVLHFLAQAIQREESFAATWQDLWTPLVAEFPRIDLRGSDLSGLTHARKRLPRKVMEHLANQFCLKAEKMNLPKWKGFRLLAIDTSTVSMPGDRELFDHFGVHKARTTTVRYPLGTFATLLSVGSSLILGYRFGPFDPGGVATSRPLFSHLGPEDLLLADRGFAGSPSLASIKVTGAEFLMRKNGRLIVENLPVIKRLGSNDFITELTMNKLAREKDPTLPKKVRVRIFKAHWKTPSGEKVTEWFITSLEDAQRYKKRTLAKLYHERWQIETSYLEFKQVFHADILRSKTVDNICKEFSAHILSYQLVRLLIHEAAEKHKKKATEISFLNATRWTLSFSCKMAYSPARRLPFMYERLLDAIAGNEIDIRPGRLEPRAMSREPKRYPRLNTTRPVWRHKRLAGAL